MVITVVGLGYVGLSMSVLLSQKYKVFAVDIDEAKIAALRDKVSPIHDAEISAYLQHDLDLHPTHDFDGAVHASDVVVIATPTDYDETTNTFNTRTVETVASKAIACNPEVCVVVKSTIPIGFIDGLREQIGSSNIYFSPEFLREGNALRDNLHPSRIIVGGKTDAARVYADMLLECSALDTCPILLTGTREAEAVKLFANSYLAMRVSFFNELDSYCLKHDLSTWEIINGVSHEPRIGHGYNNPSFGYGGYCFPKDTKQMLANFGDIPQSLIGAIVETNPNRKQFLADEILKQKPGSVGIFKLSMKQGSDNFRESAVFDIADKLQQAGVTLTFFDDAVDLDEVHGISRVANFDNFVETSDIILANRHDKALARCPEKVFTRDVFGGDE